MLLLPASRGLLDRWQAGIRAEVRTRLLVEGSDCADPLLHGRIAGTLLFQVMPIAQEMHPTALMQPLMHIVGGVEVRAQHSLEVTAQQRLDHLVPSRVMILVIAHRWGTRTPDVAVLAVFSPAGLIGLHRRTGSDRRFEPGQSWLQLRFEPMQDLDDCSTADLESMQGGQIRLDLPHWQTHHRAQVGKQARDLHSQTALPQHLGAHVYGGLAPFLALATTTAALMW